MGRLLSEPGDRFGLRISFVFTHKGEKSYEKEILPRGHPYSRNFDGYVQPFCSIYVISNQSGVEYAISFLFSMVCKGAVPLFFMVSGALLLGKMKVGKICFKKNSAHDSCNCDILVPVLYETGFKRRTSFCTVFVSAVTADGSGISAVLVFIQLSRCAYDFADPAPTGTEYVENTFWYLIIYRYCWTA